MWITTMFKNERGYLTNDLNGTARKKKKMRISIANERHQNLPIQDQHI
jgi:hypothetical protein